VGDVDQLPSVGPGMVLRDLIEGAEQLGVNRARIYRFIGQQEVKRDPGTEG